MARPRKIAVDPANDPAIPASPSTDPAPNLVEIEIGSGSLYCSCFIDKSTLNAHIEAGWRVKPQNFGN